MFKKIMMWVIWILSWFAAGFFGMKVLMKTSEMFAEKLAEIDDED